MGYKKSELNHYGLHDRVKKLLVSYEWSDCSFTVAGETMKAHKLILGISSPVFEAMFYGPLSTNDEIEVSDLEPDIFQLLLNYIYTDDVDIQSIEQAFELLYASRKYMLEQLGDICKDFIQTNISIDNVITVLNYPDYMQDKKIIAFASNLFCEHANYLLQENNALITLSCMKTALESDCMNLIEKDLIKHVFTWSKHCCEQHDILDTFDNRRDILIKNGLFKLLRFHTLSLNDIDDILNSENNLLLLHEAENIKKSIKLRNIDDKEKVVGVFQSPRNSLKLQWCLCRRTPLRSAAPVIIDSNNYVVHSRVKVDKSLFLNSLCVPTRMTPVLQFRNQAAKVYSEQISVSILCESDNTVIKYTNFMNTVEYDSTVDIELSEPCLIKKDKWYKISFIWPRNRFHTYSYVVEHRDKYYKDHKVLFEFEDMYKLVSYGGSFLGGLKFSL